MKKEALPTGPAWNLANKIADMIDYNLRQPVPMVMLKGFEHEIQLYRAHILANDPEVVKMRALLKSAEDAMAHCELSRSQVRREIWGFLYDAALQNKSEGAL